MRALCVGGALVLCAPPAVACAVFVAHGEAAPSVHDEQALIVWDEEAHREHFVRTLSFSRSESDAAAPTAIGFVVPTPGVPEIAEVNDPALFVRLARASAPRFEQVVERRWSFAPALLAFTWPRHEASVERAAIPLAEVVGRVHIAGLDAVSLRADDPQALGRWLREHDFEWRESTAEWLKPYVDNHWVITAFRYAPNETDPPVMHTRTVRLSFQSAQPIWPYREPSDTVHGPTRLLRAYVVADQRRSAVLESGAARGEVEFAGPSDANLLGDVVPGFKRAAYLTTIEDRSLVRDGGDLTFPVAATQESFRRVDRILTYDTVTLPVDLLALPVVACAVVLGLRRRRSA